MIDRGEKRGGGGEKDIDDNTPFDELLKLLHESRGECDILRFELDGLKNRPAIRFYLFFYKSIRYLKTGIKRTIKRILKRESAYRFDEDEDYILLDETHKGEANFKGRIAVHLHAYYIELLEEIISYMNNIPFNYDCYITTDSEEKKRIIQYFVDRYLKAENKTIITTPNRGRDIGPWLIECAKVNNDYRLVCHIHTKKSSHLPHMGSRWRGYLLDNLLGSPGYIRSIVSLFEQDENIGLIFPPFYVEVKSNKDWKGNKGKVKGLLTRCNIKNIELPLVPDFPAGNMIWYRTEALAPLFKAEFSYEDFECEEGQKEGTLMHVVERALVYIAESQGYQYKKAVGINELNPDVFKKSVAQRN